MEDVKVFNSDNSAVNPIECMNYADTLKHTEKMQDLPGFDAEYLDLPDYILKITHNIWEEHSVGKHYKVYSNNCVIHTGDATNVGVTGCIDNALSLQYGFPDRRLIGEDVVWSQDAPGKFFSSHRILSTATNLHESSFGPATGKKCWYRTIADCACANNYIYEEWLARDNLAICDQLGYDAEELGKMMAKGKPAKDPIGCSESMEGQFEPPIYVAKDDSAAEKLKEMLNDVYNRKMLGHITDFYASNATFNTVRNRALKGHDEITGFMLGLLGSFPNAKFSIDAIRTNYHDDGSIHASVRWWLRGLHDGLGMFGHPTNKPVEILGITQYRFEEGKIVEAWQVFDGLDVYRQIHLGDVD